MNKTTINQNVITLKAKTVLFLTFMMLCCSVVSFAQFKVNPNTVFTANNVVSSKEEANVFDSSVLGESQVVLNGQNQSLETAVNTSLPTLKVADANELTINTELKLRGDLVVEAGVLKLNHPVHVGGKVILAEDALIFNAHLIKYENAFVFYKDLSTTTQLEIFSSTSTLVKDYKADTIVVGSLVHQPITSINECNISQFKASPFSPPPEVA